MHSYWYRGLHEEIRELTEDSEKVAAKIADDRMCERVRNFVTAPREIQEVFEADSSQFMSFVSVPYHQSSSDDGSFTETEGLDIMAIILRSAEGSAFDAPAYQRIQRANKAYEEYKRYRETLDTPEADQGPTNDDAWLFEDLHVYMRLLRRSRDKQQMIELIFEVRQPFRTVPCDIVLAVFSAPGHHF